MKKKYFSVAALCLVCGTVTAVFCHLYFPGTPLYSDIVGVISGTMGAMIAYIWDDKRGKKGDQNETKK